MATANPTLPAPSLASEQQTALSRQWRRLTRVATVVAILTSPSVFFWYHRHNGWSTLWSLVATLATVIAFRGFVDIVVRRLIPWPSLFGTDDARLREEDIVNRRRSWTWRFFLRMAVRVIVIISILFVIKWLRAADRSSVTWWGTAGSI